MVKKRLFFLVLLQVALTLVTSQYVTAQGGTEVEYPDSPILDPAPVFVDQDYRSPDEDPVFVDPIDPAFSVDPIVDAPIDAPIEDPVFIDPIDPAFSVDPIVDAPIEDPIGPIDAPVEPEFPVDTVPEEPVNEEQPTGDDDGTYTVRVTKRRRVRKTTTPAPYVPCEELPEIIQAKEDAIREGFEGFTPDQCQFVIVDREVCGWEYQCGQTLTEAPTEAPIIDPEDEDSAESNEVEECEPKKKFKFENCFLKIRGLIKKKKPTRC